MTPTGARARFRAAAQRLASLRLTLVLFGLLCAACALGTAVPQGLSPDQVRQRFPSAAPVLLTLGLGHLYHGWPFRALLALLGANLLACGLGRSAEGWKNFLGRGRPQWVLPPPPGEGAAARLRAAGFRVRSSQPLAARRRCWAFLGFPLVHLAPLALLAGGFWGSTEGYVGTKTVSVGDTADEVNEDGVGAPRALPFELLVENFRLLYHPLALQVKVLPPEGAPEERLARTGETFAVDRGRWRVTLHSFDPATSDLVYSVRERGAEGWEGPFSRGKERGARLRVRPLGYKDPEVRRAEATVSLWGPGATQRARQVVAVNEPLDCDGLQLYLTAWGNDAKGRPFVGFQVTRDPGRPLVWAGAVALSLGLVLLLFGDGAWVREEGGQLVARGTRGRRSVGELFDPEPSPQLPSSLQQWGSGASNDPVVANARAVHPPRQSP